ncbi:amidohydrolase family protein [Actinoplanes sp. NPDC048967]|uniref:amidohydrolase family protein n=1 Tax=Actinoplanes sp. NPDC048967 TaxID=3155269 RepID=UPI0033C9B29F
MLAVRVARVFDGERMHDGGAVVLVSSGRIAEVRFDPDAVPDGVTAPEAPDGTLLPGLIDAHVHLSADSGPGALDRLADRPDAEVSGVIEGSLRAQLAAGVTAVRDLGDRRGAVLAWRAAAVAGLPAVVASGAPLTTTGGHCWSLGGEVSGVAEIRAAIRERAAAGADLVKIMASGGVFTPGTDTTRPQFTDDELAVAVREAHDHGLPITAHAHATSAVRQAVRAGVDGIEHCTCVTATGTRVEDDLAAALAEARIAVCATLGSDPAVVVPPAVLAMAERAGLTQAGLQDGVARLYRAGVRLVAGSDAGIGPAKPHGILPATIAEYVDSGIDPAAALAAATSVAAEVCGLGERKGRIRPGFDADLVLVDGDPIRDITTLARPRTVYLAGEPAA